MASSCAHCAQQVFKALLGQQLDVFGEHREQAAHQELRHALGRVAAAFEQLGDFGQPLGHLPGCLGRLAGRVERLRVGPDQSQPLANVRAPQVLEIDAKPLPVGKLRVVATLAVEVRIDLEHVADIAHNDKGRPVMVGEQHQGILLRLLAGVAHQNVPVAGDPAPAGPGQTLGLEHVLLARNGFVATLPPALLGLEDEAIALVEVDPLVGAALAALAPDDRALEHVVVELMRSARRIGPVDTQNVAQFAQEQRIVGALGTAFLALPAFNECVDVDHGPTPGPAVLPTFKRIRQWPPHPAVWVVLRRPRPADTVSDYRIEPPRHGRCCERLRFSKVHSQVHSRRFCGRKCVSDQIVSEERWRAATDSDDHYVYAIAL